MNPITPKRDEEMKQDNNDQNWKIKMLYDGDCPLCMREVKQEEKNINLLIFVKFYLWLNGK